VPATPPTDDILQRGEAVCCSRLPTGNLYWLALLKHAYLAACRKVGIPEGAAADRVRRDLIAARDASGLPNVPTSRLVLGLTILHLGEPCTDIARCLRDRAPCPTVRAPT
jgi:hypothetical protein